MSIRTCVARIFCVVVAGGVVGALDPAVARDVNPHPSPDTQVAGGGERVGQCSLEPATGLLLDRLSEGQVRTWHAIEDVVLASDASGQPRSETLRDLWEWAQTSGHAIHVEMVAASSVPTGIAGTFRVERVDPRGCGHEGVIRLCLENIRYAVVAPRPGGADSYARFEGLSSNEERYAEVLGHELAHASRVLESPDLVSRHREARRAFEEYFAGTERVMDRLPFDLQRRLQDGRLLLAAEEEHAESVEARILRELLGDRR